MLMQEYAAPRLLNFGNFLLTNDNPRYMMGANRVARQSTGRFLNAANISIRHRLPLGRQAVAGLLGVLAVLMPRAVRWCGQLRLLSSAGQRVILAGYCLCLIPTGLALLELDRLMRRIRQGEVFLQDNVRRIRRLIWNCAAVSLICLACARLYPPLLFVTIIMAFLCLVIAVVASIMDAATRLREENDLTIQEHHMAIYVNLNVVMAQRRISSQELAAQVGITQANLSILKTGKAKAIRFSTLDAICKALDCQPGDILEYREEESQ